MNDTEEFIQAAYFRMVTQAYQTGQISKTCYENLIDRFGYDLDEIEKNWNAFRHLLENGEYYVILDRIGNGEEMLAAETDEAKKAEYRKLLHELTIKLESLTPKGESA